MEDLLKRLQEIEPDAHWYRHTDNCLATEEVCLQAVMLTDGVWWYTRFTVPIMRMTFDCAEGVFCCVKYK